MSVYMLLEIHVKDWDAYNEYLEKVSVIIERYGGRCHVCGGKAVTIAGDWEPGRIVIVEFPSMERLQGCFASPEYAPLGAIREKAASARGIVVKGYSGL
jgi:uncharacterized protein (DUF1330 family)